VPDNFLQQGLHYRISSHRNKLAHILIMYEQKYEMYLFLGDIPVTKKK